MTTDRPRTNEGIIVSGHGQLTGGAVAVGRQASAFNNAPAADARLQERGLEEVRARLDELLRAIETHATLVNEPGVVRSAAENIASELAKEQPDKSLVTVLLDGLAANVRSVTGVIGAAEAMRAAVTAFL
jgi:hypothetical protein